MHAGTVGPLRIVGVLVGPPVLTGPKSPSWAVLGSLSLPFAYPPLGPRLLREPNMA